MNKKKIIIIGPAYPYRGGPSTFISFIYEILSPIYEVKIYNYKLLYPSFLFPGKTQFDKSSVIFKKAENIRIINSINPFNWWKTANKIKTEKPDLLIFDWWHPFFSFCHFTISLLVKKQLRNRIVFITENVISHEAHFIDKFLTKIGLLNASSFIALSSVVENDLIPFKKNRKIYRSELPIFNYGNSVNQIQLESMKKKFDLSKENKVLLFFGYVRKYKGLDILIEAISHLIKFDNNFRLIIAGEFYDDVSIYKKQISSLQLDNYIKVVNEFITNEDIANYYHLADAVMLPYRSATQSAILTVAYSYNKPVVATKVGGLEEFIINEKTGILTEPEDSEKFASAIIKLFELKTKIDFKTNIQEFLKENKFNNFPQLIEEIIFNAEQLESNKKIIS